MNPGELKHYITIEEPAYTLNADGTDDTTWSEFKSVPAKVKTVSAKSYQAQEQDEQSQTQRYQRWMVKIRYDDAINAMMRVKWQNHTFQLKGITADEKSSEYMWLHCLEEETANVNYGS